MLALSGVVGSAVALLRKKGRIAAGCSTVSQSGAFCSAARLLLLCVVVSNVGFLPSDAIYDLVKERKESKIIAASQKRPVVSRGWSGMPEKQIPPRGESVLTDSPLHSSSYNSLHI